MDFTHLHVHTQYSLLDGACKIDELVKAAKDSGMKSLAITDHGVMYGVVEFYKECIKQGIKPIIGCEVYVINGDILDKNSGRSEIRNHLVLLAKDNEGYKNLCKIVSIAHTEGFYYKPRVNKEIIKKYSKGIIALSGCMNGEIAMNILNEDYDKAQKALDEYVDIFTKEDFYLEIQANSLEEQQIVNTKMKELAKENQMKVVVTNDVHYVKYEDYEAQDILMCIQTGKKVTDTDRMKMSVNDFYLKSPNEIYMQFNDFKECMDNTMEVADKCNVTFEFGNYKLPKFNDCNGKTAYEYLYDLCLRGIDKKYGDVSDRKDIIERLEFELKTIKEMGFVDYFLIVWDFVKYAKENDIMVGPGRGSAAGSIVSYLLDITEIDPLKYNLLFERFLNPERVSMPDIDIDFCYMRRAEVIEYVTKKYGKKNVAQIITFGTMAAKAAIRDVGRVLDMPYQEVDHVAKLIPNELKITIDKALEISKELNELYESNYKVKNLINLSKKIEGLCRHASTHAAGVVITGEDITEYLPVAKSDDTIITQFNMTTVEELGLLKMDFLALRNLTIIQDAVYQIKKSKQIDIDMHNIPLDDDNVFKMISDGNTLGVFQLESDGMTAFLKEMKPSSLEDIIAGLSLYRPGPRDFIPMYIKGKNNPEDVIYDHPILKEVLENTYGTIVYQEQVMQIFRKLAGYSLGKSDVVRRAMSKKKMDVMLAEKDIFISGASKNGVSKEVAEKVYDQMIDFAKYAFNKSHAACYAYVAYQTAYLKYHYTEEFMAALITSVSGIQNKVSEYILESKKMGIDLLPPDVNESYSYFVAENKSIRFALSAIKSIGNDTIVNLVDEREKNGKFKSLSDFIERMLDYNLNKKTVESLIKVGAFDQFKNYRSQNLAVYINIYDRIFVDKRNRMNGQIDLFSLGDDESTSSNEEFPDLPELNKNAILLMEKEMSGIYISGHPLDDYKHIIGKYITYTAFDLSKKNDETGIYEIDSDEKAVVCGIINNVKLKTTRNGNVMAFVTMEDLTGTFDVIVFPNKYDLSKINLYNDNMVLIKGTTLVNEEEGVKIVLNSITPLSDIVVNEKKEERLTIEISSLKDKEKLKIIEEVLKKYPGVKGVEIFVNEDNKVRTPKLKVEISDNLLDELKNNNIKVIE